MKTVTDAVRSRGAGHLAVFGLLLLLSLLTPRALGAQSSGTTWRDCTDRAFIDYNSCLMESDGWFHRTVCDLAFEADVVWCSAKYAGEVRNAFNGL
jgi:hypothetical protein